MILDRILDHLEVRVEAFALCDVREGWRLNLAPPDMVVLHFVLTGRGEMRFGAAQHLELARDRLALVPPGVGHSILPAGGAERMLNADSADIPLDSGIHRIQAGDGGDGLLFACGRVRATYGGLAGLFDHLGSPLVEDFSAAPIVRVAFDALLAEQSDSQPGSSAMTTALMNQCFILLLRRLAEVEDRPLPWLEAVADERLARVVDAVLEHPESSHSVDTLASLAGMSRSTFADHFAKAFGRSPMDWVRETRLQRGARFLQTTDLAVKQVGRRVGFRSRSHFSQAFSDYYGVRPADYRRHAEVSA